MCVCKRVGPWRGPLEMAPRCFWDTIATVNCVACGLRSGTYGGSQCLDSIYLFEEGFQTTWLFQGLESGISYTSIGRELWFWSEQFAWSSDQFREEGLQGIPIGIMWHYQNSPSLRCGGPCPLYCIFLFPNFGFLICQMELIIWGLWGFN